MRLTPLDIHHKEFRHSIRGYSEDEVDQFLDDVADEFERLFKENIDLSERLDVLQAKVNEFEMQRQTINNTLVTAQRSADDIIVRANEEGDNILAHANARAKELVNDALAKKQHVRGELLRIKQAEEDFRARYRSLLETSMRSVTEIRLDDDVNALLGAADTSADEILVAGTPSGVQVEPQTSAPSAVQAEPSVEPQRSASRSQPTQAMPAVGLPVEPPASGFVRSVALGEITSPEIPADVELVEPGEFSLPGFDALGEREDDVDIEEID